MEAANTNYDEYKHIKQKNKMYLYRVRNHQFPH